MPYIERYLKFNSSLKIDKIKKSNKKYSKEQKGLDSKQREHLIKYLGDRRVLTIPVHQQSVPFRFKEKP